jgi:NhaP-type Na+/H+ or K+/H+ antiporter
MTHWSALLLAAAALAYALATRRLAQSVVTGPMLFAGLGLLLGGAGLGWADFRLESPLLHVLAELTLVLVLFTDAASTSPKAFSDVRSIAARMLGIGLPLAVVFGAAAAWLLFPGLSLWEAALLAAIVAPTDAALSQPVIERDDVPEDLRTAVSSESGLNDGLALPLVLLFAALAAGDSERQSIDWLLFIAGQLALGPLAGILVGGVGGWLMLKARDAAWMEEWAEGIAALAMALGAYLLAEAIGGNGFLAAFAGGFTMGRVIGGRCRYVYEFQQSEARLLVLGAFFVVGALLLPLAIERFSWQMLVFAGFALTAMRMVPIAISLLGLGLKPASVAFLGWFGPRGLASVLFALIVLDGAGLEESERLLALIGVTVGLSILVHGLTAAPLARRYAAGAASREVD